MISVHMWVQNEEDYVGACIRSVYDLADEIVIVLNPSTDRTPEILATFDKVRIIHNVKDWKEVGEDNLRNMGLSECMGDYIVIMDADEVLYENQNDRILEYIKDEGVGCWRFTQLEFYGDNFHLQDQYRGPALDGEGVEVPGFGRQVVHGHPIIYRNHPDLRYIRNAGMKYGIHCSVRGTQMPNVERYCPDIYYAHYGHCKPNRRIYGKTLFYFDAVADPNDICHTEEYRDQIDPDNPLGYHPDQAVRPFFGKQSIYMEGNPTMFHRIRTAIDDEGKARIVSRSDTPLEVEIKIGTPADCGRPGCDYREPNIDVELKRRANEYTAIKALDYYTSTVELCMIHPNVFIMLNENIPYNPQFNGRPRELIRDIIRPNARHFVAVSESVRNALLAEGIDPSRISVINFWGCETDFWMDLGYGVAEDRMARDALGISGENKLATFVGRVVEEKGIRYLLDTLPKLHDNIDIVIAGQGNVAPFMRNVDLLDRVHCTGPLDRNGLLALYNISDVLVLPSLPIPTWVEQFGRVLTEAMSCSVPCIATNLGGPVDIVDDGVTGYLVQPADSDQLAEKINYVISNELHGEILGNAGRVRCCALFGDEASTTAMRKCVREHMWN